MKHSALLLSLCHSSPINLPFQSNSIRKCYSFIVFRDLMPWSDHMNTCSSRMKRDLNVQKISENWIFRARTSFWQYAWTRCQTTTKWLWILANFVPKNRTKYYYALISEPRYSPFQTTPFTSLMWKKGVLIWSRWDISSICPCSTEKEFEAGENQPNSYIG
jgi:hypothetical protein